MENQSNSAQPKTESEGAAPSGPSRDREGAEHFRSHGRGSDAHAAAEPWRKHGEETFSARAHECLCLPLVRVLGARKHQKGDEEADKWRTDTVKAVERIRQRRGFRFVKAQKPSEEPAGPIARFSWIRSKREPAAPVVGASRLGRCKSKVCSAGANRISVLRGCRRHRRHCVRCASDNRSRRGPKQAQEERQPDMSAARRTARETDVAGRHPPCGPLSRKKPSLPARLPA
jgi:hypothetical protein